MADMLTITLTDHAPICINKANWPFLASAKDHDGQVECQANQTWKLCVRQHQNDNRTIVYGTYDTNWQGKSGRRGGVYLDDKETNTAAIIVAIKQVGEYLGFEQSLIDECIADLPAEEVE